MLATADVRGVEADHLVQAAGGQSGSEPGEPVRERVLVRREDEEQRVHLRPVRSTPAPVRRRRWPLVAEQPAAVGARDALEELQGEARRRLGWQAEPGQAGGGEREVQRTSRRARLAEGDRGEQLVQPASGRLGVDDLQDDVRRGAQLAVALQDEALDVARLDPAVHSSRNHASGSSPSSSPLRPLRSLAFWSIVTAARSG